MDAMNEYLENSKHYLKLKKKITALKILIKKNKRTIRELELELQSVKYRMDKTKTERQKFIDLATRYDELKQQLIGMEKKLIDLDEVEFDTINATTHQSSLRKDIIKLQNQIPGSPETLTCEIVNRFSKAKQEVKELEEIEKDLKQYLDLWTCGQFASHKYVKESNVKERLTSIINKINDVKEKLNQLELYSKKCQEETSSNEVVNLKNDPPAAEDQGLTKQTKDSSNQVESGDGKEGHTFIQTLYKVTPFILVPVFVGLAVKYLY